jgi:hypothetical protein
MILPLVFLFALEQLKVPFLFPFGCFEAPDPLLLVRFHISIAFEAWPVN